MKEIAVYMDMGSDKEAEGVVINDLDFNDVLVAARLFRAAPDMLAALEKFVAWADGKRFLFAAAIDEARAAIKKAKGEA